MAQLVTKGITRSCCARLRSASCPLHYASAQLRTRCAVLQNDVKPIASYSDTSDEDVSSGASLFSDAAVLFDRSHVHEWSPMLALYLPFGLVIAALRSALWIMGIALDAPWFRNER